MYFQGLSSSEKLRATSVHDVPKAAIVARASGGRAVMEVRQ